MSGSRSFQHPVVRVAESGERGEKTLTMLGCADPFVLIRQRCGRARGDPLCIPSSLISYYIERSSYHLVDAGFFTFGGSAVWGATANVRRVFVVLSGLP